MCMRMFIYTIFKCICYVCTHVCVCMQFYGSEIIRHYSDFGGSQVIMDKFVSKAHRFAANLRNFARKSKNSKGILVFTHHDMQLYGEKKQASSISLVVS